MIEQAKDKTFIRETKIPGLLVIKRPVFEDNRGFFREVFHLDDLVKASGIDFRPVQWNHSRSLPKVIRGLHAENWNKIVYPATGKAFVAIVDIRPSSSTFGSVLTFILDDSNRSALFIPEGLANSICVMGTKPVDYIYLVDKYYDGTDTRAIAWNDPDLSINWPIRNPIVSERDRNNPRLRELFPEKFNFAISGS